MTAAAATSNRRSSSQMPEHGGDAHPALIGEQDRAQRLTGAV